MRATLYLPSSGNQIKVPLRVRGPLTEWENSRLAPLPLVVLPVKKVTFLYRKMD